MTFYSSIAPWYDEIFPFDPDTADMLSAAIPSGGAVLDLACGTGRYALALARRGLSITGIDLDPGMIERAQAASGDGGPDFSILDMRIAPATFAGRHFNLIYCIGNSLVHLASREEIETLLRDLHPLLESDGRILLQILNYDRILDQEIRDLPQIDRPGLSFLRTYRRNGARLLFATELRLRDGRKIRNEVPLLPLRASELSKALLTSGFRAESWLGDFDGCPLTPDAPCVVVTACA